MRFCRLVFGLRPSPAILGATIRHHVDLYKDQHPALVELIKKSLYVDDLITGEDNVDNTFSIYQNSKKMMSEGGFNLRKWKSNSSALTKAINHLEAKDDPPSKIQVQVTEEDSSYTKATLGSGESSNDKIVKTLGVHWNIETDELLFNLQELIKYAELLPVTKRTLLQLTAKIFDPLGLLSPFTIKMKVLFQTLCTEKIEWDEELQGNMRSKWNSLLSELESLNNISIPRCYFNPTQKPASIQLHGFSDASEQAYAALVTPQNVITDTKCNTNAKCNNFCHKM